ALPFSFLPAALSDQNAFRLDRYSDRATHLGFSRMGPLYDYWSSLERNWLLPGISPVADSDCTVGRSLCGHVFSAGGEHFICVCDFETCSSFFIRRRNRYTWRHANHPCLVVRPKA